MRERGEGEKECEREERERKRKRKREGKQVQCARRKTEGLRERRERKGEGKQVQCAYSLVLAGITPPLTISNLSSSSFIASCAFCTSFS